MGGIVGKLLGGGKGDGGKKKDPDIDEEKPWESPVLKRHSAEERNKPKSTGAGFPDKAIQTSFSDAASSQPNALEQADKLAKNRSTISQRVGGWSRE